MKAMANEVNRRGFFAGVAGLLTLTPFAARRKDNWGRLCELPEIGTEWPVPGAVLKEVMILFPDGSTLTFNGTLEKFKPSDCIEGEFRFTPEGTLTYIEGDK